jgi:hypothetical protein
MILSPVAKVVAELLPNDVGVNGPSAGFLYPLTK